MSTVDRAVQIAAQAHTGQTRWKREKGLPYIIHAMRVMLDTRFINTDKERIVAILHDVVEDTPWTFDDLRAEGFDEEIITALDSVTKRAGEDYADFIERSGKNEIGRKVKLADLHDNNKPPTLKYEAAIQRLLALELA